WTEKFYVDAKSGQNEIISELQISVHTYPNLYHESHEVTSLFDLKYNLIDILVDEYLTEHENENLDPHTELCTLTQEKKDQSLK
ncbi:hypothetical protein HI914_04184, partial [Erysiphe necator]